MGGRQDFAWEENQIDQCYSMNFVRTETPQRLRIVNAFLKLYGSPRILN